MKNFLLLFLVIFTAASCAKNAEYDKEKAVSAFAVIDKIKIDTSLEKTPVTIPAQQKNNIWSGSAGSLNQQIENFARIPRRRLEAKPHHRQPRRKGANAQTLGRGQASGFHGARTTTDSE